jgi:SAM-dependent methyltransferase
MAFTIGRSDFVLDIGSGRLPPYKDVFDWGAYVSIDRFEDADVLGDAAVLPFASNRADLILCTEVLEHLPDPVQALTEMKRVLAPRGFLIITVPLIWGEHDYVDYQRWTESGLRKMLRSAGFRVQEIERRGGIFAMLGCMVTRIPHQVFGTFREQRSWLLKTLYLLLWLGVAPVPWLLALLDGLDRRKAFTVGYSVLCQKELVQESV